MAVVSTADRALKKMDSLPFDTVYYMEADYTIFRAKLTTREDADVWLAAYEAETKTHWVVRKTYPEVQKLVFRKDYVCQHTSFSRITPSDSGFRQQVPRNRRGKSKNCACPASLVIKVYMESSREQYTKVSGDHGLSGTSGGLPTDDMFIRDLLKRSTSP